MRKRLIEKFTKAKEGSFGYTMTELLVVVAIIAIVAAIAIPSVIAISRALKFKRVNDHAKSIFLAAQQNLTEMRSDGGLTPLQGTMGPEGEVNSVPIAKGHSGFPESEWSDEYVYTASALGVSDSQRDTYALVLPVGSIEGTVRDQQVIIEYNPITGNVYSVFYSEEEGSILTAYSKGALPRDDKVARKNMMLGYYFGSGLSSTEIELEESVAEVEFTNGEEGIVTVKIPMPSLYYGKSNTFIDGLEVSLTVLGEQYGASFTKVIKNAVDATNPVSAANATLGPDGKTVLVTYVLDSLADGSSFANLSANSDAGIATLTGSTFRVSTVNGKLTSNAILPGENVTLIAEVDFTRTGSNPAVTISDGVLAGVNPMFDYLDNSGTSDGRYTLAVANGRNLQNLNALHPAIADQVDAVVFTSDIDWNTTVAYYNKNHGRVSGTEDETGSGDGTQTAAEEEEEESTPAVRLYKSSVDEAPARALPYFVPIHNEKLFGTAYFAMNDGKNTDGFWNKLWTQINDFVFPTVNNSEGVPVLTDMLDMGAHKDFATGVATGRTIAQNHATIHGNNHRIYNIKIDTTKYPTYRPGTEYYAGVSTNRTDTDRFTGLFGYANTHIDNLYVVNPIVKGYGFVVDASGKPNNPATGALLGAGGYNTFIRGCGVYLENINWADASLDADPSVVYVAGAEQTRYGVSGCGAVGGLVGYAKSHRTVTGRYQQADEDYLAFSNCFAAVNVSGEMRDNATVGKVTYDFGYTNGIGGFIGNSQLTNFYKCYASGNVRGTNAKRDGTFNKDISETLGLYYSGRTSYGVGGFVGSSHGTRYTNCFATGAARNANGGDSVGGFVGVMCYDETWAYGLDIVLPNQWENNPKYANVTQHTVFENCYALGVGRNKDFVGVEGFSGTNARIGLSYSTLKAYYVGDYYRLLAPYYLENKTDPQYNTHYIYKDSYYLSQPEKYSKNDSNVHSDRCATPAQDTDLIAMIDRSEGDLLAAVKQEPLDGQLLDAIVKQIFIDSDAAIKAIGNILIEQMEGLNPLEVALKLLRGDFDTSYNIYFRLAEELHISGMETAYLNSYRRAYTDDDWSMRPVTHYYGDNAGRIYPFPMIRGMEYYGGDWPSVVLQAGIAYYEEYLGGEIGYHMDRQDTSGLKNSGNYTIVSDGYAIMTTSKATPTVEIGGKAIGISDGVARTLMDAEGLNKQKYTAYHLNMDDVMAAVTETNGTYGSDFYIEVKVTVGGVVYKLYMNPNVAIGHVNDSYSSVVDVPIPDSIKIRTARQFAAIGTMDSFWDMDYVQQLNIDADTYAFEEIPALKTIGTKKDPFTGSYNGKSGYTEMAAISGFTPAVDNEIAGYFGVVGEDGSISNLTVEQEDAKVSGVKNAGVLVGICNGDITNVKLNVTGDTEIKATENAGLLAGKATGSIQSCVVKATGTPVVTASNAEAANAGGVIGYAEEAEILDSSVELKNGICASATNAGGFVGSAEKCDIQNIVVTGIKTMSDAANMTFANADAAGGFAGMISGGTVTTVDVAMHGTNGDSKVGGYMGGAIGKAEGGTFVDVSVVIPAAAEVNGDTVGGIFGKVTGAAVKNSDVVVNHRIEGTTNAGGFAGIVGAGDQVIEGTYVTINQGVVESAGRAAGFAVEFGGQTNGVGVKLGSKTVAGNSGSIIGNSEAAGFACVVTGQVNSGKVMGKGQITAKGTSITDEEGATTTPGKAAGFAVTLSGKGRIAASSVSPAMGDQPSDYLNKSNDNLVVNGGEAAGFVLNVATDEDADNTGIDGSHALCKLTGAKTYGFVGTNAGRINGSMANVTIPVGGYTFAGTNSGKVTNCYGWFAEATADNSPNTTVDFTKYPGYGGETGTYTSCYFVDIMLNEALANGEATAVLFDNKSVRSEVTAAKIRDSLDSLNSSEVGAVLEWRAGGTQVSCPYSSDLSGESYPYPELRSHYGNWIIPPQYSYGVAYYEAYDVTPEGETEQKLEYKIHAINLSVPAEGAAVESTTVTYPSATFTENEGQIVDTGYVLFCEESSTPFKNNIMGAKNNVLPTDGINNNTKGKYVFYNFSDKVNGEITVNGSRGLTAKVNLYYADAISVGSSIGTEPAAFTSYNVRTKEQLDNVSHMADKAFVQTHDISGDKFTAIADFTGSYDGSALNITMENGTAWMTAMNGTVTGVDLDISGDVTAPVFGTIGAGKSVTLKDLDVGKITTGSVVGEVKGSFTCPTINAGDVETSLFGAVNGGSVTVANGINVGAVTDNVFGTINGTVTTGAVSTLAVGTAAEGETAGKNANIFGNINGGTVTVASVTTNGQPVYGNVFGEINGTVNVGTVDTAGNFTGGPITTGAVTGNVFGDITSGTVTSGTITTGALSGNVFGDVSANVTTESITAGVVTGDIFGNISNSKDANGNTVTTTVTTGKIKVASLSGKLAGTVGGTLQGSASEAKAIDLGTTTLGTNFVNSVGSDGVLKNYSISGITTMTAPLVGGELGGTLNNVTVDVATASVGTNSGILVNSVDEDASVIGCRVEADTASSDAEYFGGLTGTNEGTLTDNTVLIGTTSTDGEGKVTVTPGILSVSGKTVGGLVGSNSGTISGADVTADISYTGTGDTTIGGIVGEMTGGSLTNSTVSGSIAPTETLSDKDNVIGGAVGKDAGTSAPVVYSAITSAVSVDAGWAGSTGISGTQDPAGKGPVGMFVGHVTNGDFSGCSSTAANTTYQFLGQINTVNSALPTSGDTKDWFGYSSTTGNTFDCPADKTLAEIGTANGYKSYADGDPYTDLAAKLSNCTFVYGAGENQKTYTQTIRAIEYFHLGERLTIAGGYRPVELTSGSPYDNISRQYAITNTDSTLVFTGGASGTAFPALNERGYYSQTTYDGITKWSIEQREFIVKYYVWKSGNMYLYLYRDNYVTGMDITTGISAKKTDTGFSLRGTNRNLISSPTGFSLSENAGTVKIWYFETVADSYECTFTYPTDLNLYSKTCVGVDVDGNELTIPASLSEEPEIPAEEVGGETGNNT